MTIEALQKEVQELELLVRQQEFALAGDRARNLLDSVPELDDDDNLEPRCRILNVWVESQWRQGNGTKVLTLAKTALRFAEQLNDKKLEAKALNALGQISESVSDTFVALEYFTRALSAANESGDRKVIATQLGATANVYTSLARYNDALDHYNQALALFNQVDDKLGVALCTGNIGNVHGYLSNFPAALEFFKRALSISEEIGFKRGIALNTSNIAQVFCNMGDFNRSLEYSGRALALAEQDQDLAHQANIMGVTGITYMWLGDYTTALEWMSKALERYEKLGNKAGASRNIGNIALVYKELGEYELALDYYKRSMEMDLEIGNKRGAGVVMGSMATVYKQLGQYDVAMKYLQEALDISIEFNNKVSHAVQLANIGSLLATQGELEKAFDLYKQSLAMAEEIGDSRGVAFLTGNIGALLADKRFKGYDESEAERTLLKAIALNDELGSKAQNIELFSQLADIYEKRKSWEAVEYLRKHYELKAEIQSDELRKQANLLTQRRIAADREKELTAERAAAAATVSLLYKVLPNSVADRLVNGEKVADYFNQISILFADIVGFTPIAARMPAKAVLAFLNYVFGEFDRVMKRHGVQKIKTIGDGYMAVAGAPVECSDHAERLARAALELMNDIHLPDELRKTLPKGSVFHLRIGLHTGSAFAGIVGEEGFVYDVYSDAVNLAARMESSGEPGKIHCSEEFALHLQNRDESFVFEERGEIDIKGKGLMRTFYLGIV